MSAIKDIRSLKEAILRDEESVLMLKEGKLFPVFGFISEGIVPDLEFYETRLAGYREDLHDSLRSEQTGIQPPR